MIKFKGLDKFKAFLGRAARKIPFEMDRQLLKSANKILTEAKDLVPIDTGALHDSGRVALTKEGSKRVVTISFGNDKVDYALAVHEDLFVIHRNGQAKYLVIPLRRNQRILLEDLTKAMRMAFTNTG